MRRRNYVTVEVDVDVDLDDIDIEDLIEYIEYKGYSVSKNNENAGKFVFTTETVLDEMRAEYLLKVYEQYFLEMCKIIANNIK